MRCLLFLCVFAGISFYAYAQTFAIGHTTYLFADTTRPDREITAEIFYPAMFAGDDAPAVADEIFPYVIMSHGFLMTYDAYAYIWETLVPAGYIVVLPTTAGEFFPDHTEYAKDIAFLSLAVYALSDVSSNVLYGHIKNSCAAMGHSMGGGATFLALTYPNVINTSITFAAAETSPSAIEASAIAEVPALIFAGSDDCVTPSSTNQELMYANIPVCKTLINITGASHCQFADYDFTCSLGELFCSSAIDIETQHQIVNTFMMPWLQFFLYDDLAGKITFQESLLASSEITFMQDCETLTPIEENIFSEKNKSIIYPNPASNFIYMQSASAANCTLLNISGQQVLEFIIAPGLQKVNLGDVGKGTYILHIQKEDNTDAELLIIN